MSLLLVTLFFAPLALAAGPPPVMPELSETPGKAGTTVVLLGHAYPLLETPADFERFLDAVAAESAEHVFLLGDCGLEDPQVVALVRAKLGQSAHFLPGNHELQQDRGAAFAASAGDDQWVLDSGPLRFVGINSSLALAQIEGFLSSALEGAEQRPVMLLAHHRIWDDTLIDPEPFGHDKSFRFAELLPLLQGRVELIVAGNSRRQYFRDHRTSPLYGNQNLNNVFFCDLVANIPCYSVGMGDGRPKAGYVVARRGADGWRFEPRAVLLEGSDPPSAEAVDPPRPNPFHSESAEAELTRGLWLRYGGAGVLLGGLLGFALCLLLRRGARSRT